jgi:hypothetical protein
MKRAPEQTPDPEKYERGQALMQHLHTRAKHGEGDGWYFDGSGFCFTPAMPYAWQRISSVIDVPTSTQNQRMNV